jgi:hypothetical protein
MSTRTLVALLIGVIGSDLATQPQAAPWERGQPQDVSETGCLWVTPTSACPKEFDLVKVEGNRLFLGERPQPGQDLCHEDRRAQKLRSLPLIRR